MDREKLITKCPGGAILGEFTRAQALRVARKTMEPFLRANGFEPFIVRCTAEINGWDGFRIAYGRKA